MPYLASSIACKLYHRREGEGGGVCNKHALRVGLTPQRHKGTKAQRFLDSSSSSVKFQAR